MDIHPVEYFDIWNDIESVEELIVALLSRATYHEVAMILAAKGPWYGDMDEIDVKKIYRAVRSSHHPHNPYPALSQQYWEYRFGDQSEWVEEIQERIHYYARRAGMRRQR